MDKQHTYWKRPWQKHVCLVGAALHLLLLAGTLRDYRRYTGAGIFSPDALEEYTAKMSMLACLEAACAALLLAGVVLGAVYATRAAARRAEGWILLGLGLAWGAAGPLLPLWKVTSCRWEWAGILALLLLSGAWMLFRKVPPADKKE